jgi:translation initiation factor 5B
MAIRQPIVTVIGHVDSGKTTILDAIRSTSVAQKEAGGITQAISFTGFPSEIIEKKCKNLLEQFKIKLDIPGFLFIDTPGHAAFTNLRKRGGALADVAILVIDINEGVMPQTEESIEILKANKTPFVVALNKIDTIAGWKHQAESIKENLEKQSEYTKKNFEDKMYRIMGQLSNYGFDSDVFYRINDFTKQIALVPCSARKNEGISELIVMLAGLSQRFLKGRLMLKEGEAKGTVLELKKEKDMTYLEAIIYEGILNIGDNIVIGSFDKPVVTKIRALFSAMPLGKGFASAKQVKAAAGMRIQAPDTAKILPGMPFVSLKDMKRLKSAEDEVQKEIHQAIKLDKEGIIIKAESLGSLEALLLLLRKSGIKISKAGIGDITKSDVISGSVNLREKPLDAVILGFNVKMSEEIGHEENVKIIANDVVYRLIEDFEKWLVDRKKELERQKLAELTLPCKLKVLKYVFHQSKPAIFGVRVEGGFLKPNMQLISSKNETIDKVKNIQSHNKAVLSAKKAEEVAISLPSITYGRQVRENDILYSNISEYEFRKLKESKKLLNNEEITILQEIASIKRREKDTWGI